jgi:F0F1-type ATP synthase delta subunit
MSNKNKDIKNIAGVYFRGVKNLSSTDEIRRIMQDLQGLVAAENWKNLTMDALRKINFEISTKNLLKLILSNRQRAAIPYLAEMLNDFLIQQDNQEFVIIQSSDPLSEKFIRRVEEVFAEYLKKKIVIKLVIDQKFKKGVFIRSSLGVLDLTLERQLSNFAKTVIKNIE